MDKKYMINFAVNSLISKFSKAELLDLQLYLDGTPEDLFFEELTERLVNKYPEEFKNLEELDESCV